MWFWPRGWEGETAAFLFSSKFLFFLTSASHCFQFQWGAARQLEPLPGYSASNINKNIGEFQSPGFPSSVRLHTSPSPSRVQLLSAANTAFSHNCPAPQVPSVQSPPLSPSPSPHPSQPGWLPTIVDLFMTLTVTRLLLKSLLPLSRTNKQSRRPQVTSCTFQLLHSFTFYIRSTPVHWLAFYYRADSPDLQPNPKQICPTAQPDATQAHPLSAFCADCSNYSIIILLILFWNSRSNHRLLIGEK